jgi:hypothetical protein
MLGKGVRRPFDFDFSLRLRLKKPTLRGRSMTICIAAFAAENKAIACIADRAVTYSSTTGGPSSQADSGAEKIVELGRTGWVALIADDVHFAQKVTDKIIECVGATRSPTVQQMRTWAKDAYEKCQEEEIVVRVLTPNLLTREDFSRRSNTLQPLDTKYVLEIARLIQEVDVCCTLLVCGFDAQGPHILRVRNGGGIEPCDIEGYGVIGGGEDTSRGRMIWSETDRSDELESVMYDVFDAKVCAEIIQGVGYVWDWRILLPNKRPRKVPERISNLIDRLWISKNKSPFSEIQVKAPKNWKRRLAAFATQVLGA